jgi:hypothetical protein
MMCRKFFALKNERRNKQQRECPSFQKHAEIVYISNRKMYKTGGVEIL